MRYYLISNKYKLFNAVYMYSLEYDLKISPVYKRSRYELES